MDCSMPDFPVHHQLTEITQAHVHQVGDAIQVSHPLLSPSPASIFPSIRIFSNESVLCIRWPSIGVSASALILPMNIQDWFPLGWTGLISLLSKGLSRVFSSTTVQKHHFFGAQPSLFRPWVARPGHRAPSGFCPSLLNTHPSSVINKAGVSNMQTL